MSPTSSRNRVPPLACSILPSVVLTAPVKAPFSWPNSSDSSRFSGIAAQLSRQTDPFFGCCCHGRRGPAIRSEEHTSELQSLMRNSYAVFCLQKKRHTASIQHQYNISQQ